MYHFPKITRSTGRLGVTFAALIAVSLTVAPAATAAERGPREVALPRLVTDNPSVEKQVHKSIVRAEHAGAEDIHVVAGPYKRATTAGRAQAAALPSGCSLSVVLYRVNNTITSDSLTHCLFPADSILMDSKISRSRWYGWEELVADKDSNAGSNSLALTFNYNCSATGIHDFRTETDGELLLHGADYQAAAYDEEDDQNCG